MTKVIYYLCKVERIFRNSDGTIQIDCNDGTVTRAFEKPRQGLHLKKGDLAIRHEAYDTVAIDKVVVINGHSIKIKRVLGTIKEVPSIKGQPIELTVFCE